MISVEADPTPRATDVAPRVRAPERLKKRRDFLTAARARKWSTTGFVLQARRRRPDEAPAGARVGFTASKKVGNAVARNRAKRRLRAASDDVISAFGRPEWDYVLIARAETTVAQPFRALLDDLRAALDRVHQDRPKSARLGGRRTPPTAERV